jgi:hypothetical protein
MTRTDTDSDRFPFEMVAVAHVVRCFGPNLGRFVGFQRPASPRLTNPAGCHTNEMTTQAAVRHRHNLPDLRE